METENGFAYQVLVLVIVIIIAMAGVLINKLIGRNGVIEKVATVETEFSKEDVVERINHIVTQKFIEINNEAKANNRNISEMYNSDVVIEFLKQNLIIEEMQDAEGNFQEGTYHINIGKLKDEETEVHYVGKFQLEKIDDAYMIVWYDEKGNSKKIGELQIQQMI